MKDENKWQCSNCFKKYTFEEFIKLKNEYISEDKSYGKASICTCGKMFHRDKWKIVTKVEKGFWFKKTYAVSTIHLELNHFGFWYETMVFDKKHNSLFSERYKTKEEAEKRHREIVNDVKCGKIK